jgi:hypothetical protein
MEVAHLSYTSFDFYIRGSPMTERLIGTVLPGMGHDVIKISLVRKSEDIFGTEPIQFFISVGRLPSVRRPVLGE